MTAKMFLFKTYILLICYHCLRWFENVLLHLATNVGKQADKSLDRLTVLNDNFGYVTFAIAATELDVGLEHQKTNKIYNQRFSVNTKNLKKGI